ncbi:putative helicase [Klebsiella phage vB_KaeD_HazelMika]|nr:putative helicase [Klebsiella phage vB_KaeD_HazelMika]
MKIKSIKKQIAELGEAKIKEIQEAYTFNGVVPYAYQCVMFDEIGKRIGKYQHPFFVKASVSAGKTIGFAMVCKRLSQMISDKFPKGLPAMILARQGDIVAQDSEEITNFGVPNSVYCAGLNTKSAYFPIIVGSEGTVANGLFKALGDFVPFVLGIDECHQVDWEDLADSIDKKESYEEMSRPKDEAYMINGEVCEPGIKISSLLEQMNTVAPGAGRAQYTVIIRTLQERCKRVHGKELRIFGMTGSEFRGTTPILVENMKLPGFWREQVTNIDTNYLIEFGSVVPTVFGGTEGLGYDLSEFKASGQDGTADFSAAEMKKMEKKIHDNASMTKRIIEAVVKEAQNRNGVLITCSGQRHCKEAASYLPPDATYAIITEKTGTKQRQQILEDANKGKIKYIFQVVALTTGVNVPFWDFSVILRKIGSLTLLIQLLGRGMRLLKPWQKLPPYNMVKEDHLVWDFAGTMDELGQLYFDPILEEAQYQRRFDSKKEPKKCPICGTENSFFARRCIKKDGNGNRCEHFWKSRECEDQIDNRTGEVLVKGCGTQNDIVARICRHCDVSLKDPNENLTGKAYTKNDWCEVLDFSVGLTRNQTGIIYTYRLRDNMGVEFTAYEKFFPESQAQICGTLWKKKGVEPHVADSRISKLMGAYRSARLIMQNVHHIMKPVRVTHRKNGKGEDIISRKDFGIEVNV